MANTVTLNWPVIALSAIDTDWNWTIQRTGTGVDNTRGLPIYSIQFQPGAANDILIVRNGSLSGAPIVAWKCADEYDYKVYYCGGLLYKPYIKVSECVFSSGHRVIFTEWNKA